ncbi:phage shock protein operon transcriptional activator [Rosenbergiella nectarea]|uniref:phage shock protein operon transcriptional activator n=1 Tax=Rosenbergiella nectarea TaxID=988801 RepID=UPI001BDA200B|nr:phage shock protein operon transcriptional activator [Rosenbergiella nectarea]MBT0729287.1 phage shock protein operon transcriptional activator [Rosenbergiella nectarea subsp. apis]
MISDSVLGESENFLNMLDHVSTLAPLNKPVIIQGERGSGKELVAQRLHFLSTRWQENFITLNCAALNENLLDSELFGHETGAFTGAQKRHQGRFERAHQGTLFLDEIGNAPLVVQEKLLRAIEYGEIERMGGTSTLTVDVRVICATHEDLPARVAAGKFRADLLDRLAFDVIYVPPLRHRQADILPLANHFAMQMCRELNRPYFPGFSQFAEQQLLTAPWPGNVRELKNVIERSIYRSLQADSPLSEVILSPFQAPASQPTSMTSQPSCPTLPINLREWQHQQEADFVKASLQQFPQHTLAAKALGLTYHQFRALLKKHSL